MTSTNTRPLGELIREVLRRHRLDGKITETRIMASWEKVMGTHIARYTDNVSVRQGRLTVYLRSSVLRNELEYAREKIIQKINEELGEQIVQDVVFR